MAGNVMQRAFHFLFPFPGSPPSHSPFPSFSFPFFWHQNPLPFIHPSIFLFLNFLQTWGFFRVIENPPPICSYLHFVVLLICLVNNIPFSPRTFFYTHSSRQLATLVRMKTFFIILRLKGQISGPLPGSSPAASGRKRVGKIKHCLQHNLVAD